VSGAKPTGHDVRRSSIRVALAATGLVAAAYLIVAVAVLAIFTQSQVQQIDAQLTNQLATITPDRHDSDEPYEAPRPIRPGGLPFALWRIDANGKVTNDPSNRFGALPASVLGASSPQTASIGGNDVRIAVASMPDGDRVVLAQSLEPLNESRGTIVRAELVIAPLLLVAVFLGAVAIGRRVATPIELARRRQLEFTADASHELRTPLSVIEANASLALQQDRDEDWYRTAFERVDRESKRMRRLVDDLLWLARFDATHASPASEPVDVALLAGQTVDRFAAIAETRRLRLSVDASGDGLVVSAPPEWLDRLLGVLVDNACKYSPDAGIVRISVAAHGGRVSLTVDDAGSGIPLGERPHIFDRFHRATDAAGGAGLGLAIADAIVRATHGRWTVGDAPPGGARMAVSWPAAFGGTRAASRGARTQAGLDPRPQASSNRQESPP
jgi:two-component system, OmpR family, sensor histidine kinase CiaH